MQHFKRLVLSILLATAVFSGTAVSAATTTNLPPGILIGDQDGLSVNVDGSYFIDAPDLHAGDVITKTLTLRNTEPYSYTITMTADPLTETGPIDLLDEVSVVLSMDGTTLYSGRVRGDQGVNMIQNALNLGNYNTGDQKTLNITMTVDPNMPTYYWSASDATFKWNFYAARQDTSTAPKTGDIVTYGLYVLMPAMLLTMGTLLVVKKKRQKKESEFPD